MPQLRKDPVVDRWVIISAARASRPNRYRPRKDSPRKSPCQFCSGNEALTPDEIWAIRPDGSKANMAGWRLRVLPNKFPALLMLGRSGRRHEGVYERMDSLGAHEVIIETPDHVTNMGHLSEKQLEDLFRAYRERLLRLKKDKRLRYIQIFKNQGWEAGASIEHAHSQLMALPIVPGNVAAELSGAKKYYQRKGHCVYCQIVRQEIEGRTRLISESERFVAICPFASRSPFETWILPKKHSSHFEYASKREYADLARSLKDTLARLNRRLNDPPFNYVVHSFPVNGSSEKTGRGHYHWHIEIMPKLIQAAGFELGSGFYINTAPPEGSARSLREVAL